MKIRSQFVSNSSSSSYIMLGFSTNTPSDYFPSEEELMQHKQIVHGKELPYDCKLCDLTFTNMQDMRAHLQRFHSYKNA